MIFIALLGNQDRDISESMLNEVTLHLLSINDNLHKQQREDVQRGGCFIWQKQACGPPIFFLADSHLIPEISPEIRRESGVFIYTHTHTHTHTQYHHHIQDSEIPISSKVSLPLLQSLPPTLSHPTLGNQ